MKTIFHRNTTVESWQTKDIVFQILSIGAEFGRAKNAIIRGNKKEFINSLERAMELADLCTYDPKWKSRLKELLRMREWMGYLYLEEPMNLELCKSMYKCLLQFHPQTHSLEV